MTLTRRFAFLAALGLWQGGFIFYGAVVVPIGASVLGSDLEQGFITRRVTVAINVAGAVALAAAAWELLAARAGRGRWLLWAVLLGTLVALLWVHGRMDALLDADTHDVAERPAFRAWHRWYLRAITAQWLAAMALLAATLRAWRAEDSARTTAMVSDCQGQRAVQCPGEPTAEHEDR